MAEKTSHDWTVKVSSKAEKYFLKLGKPTRKRFTTELMSLCTYEDPSQHPDVRPLVGPLKGFHRLRIAGYRIVFQLLKEKRTIAVVNIAPRGDVYKK